MSVLKLKITTGRPNTELVTRYESGVGPRSVVNNLSSYLLAIASGNELAQDSSNPPSVNIIVQGSETQASGTFTLVSSIATDTLTINGVTFTCVASGATGNQWNVGGTDTISATNLAAAINGSVTALVAGYVTATSALGVVTVTSVAYSLPGNQTTIASGQSTITASGARLTGGAADAASVTLSF